jgi:hypothetical protein
MPLNFFMCSYVKSAVYECLGQVANLDQITEAVETVIPEMLRCVWTEIRYFLDVFCATKGVHEKIY